MIRSNILVTFNQFQVFIRLNQKVWFNQPNFTKQRFFQVNEIVLLDQLNILLDQANILLLLQEQNTTNETTKILFIQSYFLLNF